jgi:hypothetical protein
MIQCYQTKIYKRHALVCSLLRYLNEWSHEWSNLWYVWGNAHVMNHYDAKCFTLKYTLIFIHKIFISTLKRDILVFLPYKAVTNLCKVDLFLHNLFVWYSIGKPIKMNDRTCSVYTLLGLGSPISYYHHGSRLFFFYFFNTWSNLFIHIT